MTQLQPTPHEPNIFLSVGVMSMLLETAVGLRNLAPVASYIAASQTAPHGKASLQRLRENTGSEHKSVATRFACSGPSRPVEKARVYSVIDIFASHAAGLLIKDEEDVVIGPLIGTGGFGKVFKGNWRSRTVAVKILPGTTVDASTRCCQQTEVALCMVLSHPNVVCCYHISTPHEIGECPLHVDIHTELWKEPVATLHMSPDGHDTQLFLEFCDQGSLYEACISRRFFVSNGMVPDLRAMLLRARDVAMGMVYLHACNVCHGDLKCDNVLLTRDLADPYGCVAKVGDFGASSILLTGETHCHERTQCTITHAAPEVLACGQLSPASDVFSFGITLWELVMASTPYVGLGGAEVSRMVIEGHRLEFPGHIPQEIVQLAKDCWSQEPNERPTFAEVNSRLCKLLEDADELQAQCETSLKGLQAWFMTF